MQTTQGEKLYPDCARLMSEKVLFCCDCVSNCHWPQPQDGHQHARHQRPAPHRQRQTQKCNNLLRLLCKHLPSVLHQLLPPHPTWSRKVRFAQKQDEPCLQETKPSLQWRDNQRRCHALQPLLSANNLSSSFQKAFVNNALNAQGCPGTCNNNSSNERFPLLTTQQKQDMFHRCNQLWCTFETAW